MSVKISELPILDSLADNDVIAGVDTSANVTSKIEMATLKNYIDTNTQYTAGTNIDITNNVVSAPNVYNKTETDELLEEKDEQIEELQSEVDSLSTIFNAFPTESGEGESLTLDDTAEVKFKKFDLKGNTSQTTYSGKNLIDSQFTTRTLNGVTITNNGDGTYTLNGTSSASSAFALQSITGQESSHHLITNIKNNVGKYLTMSTGYSSNQGYYLQLNLSNQGGGSGQYGFATSVYTYSNTLITSNESDIAYINFFIGIMGGASFNNLKIYPMITIQSSQITTAPTPSDFEPYVGGTASPNPSYPQPVNVVSGDNVINICGKNVFDGVIEQGNYDASTGAKTASNAFYRNANKIPVLPSTTYTFSINGVSQRYVVLFYQANGTFISQNASLTTGTFTTPSNAYYVNFRCFQSDYTSDYATLKVQLEKGSSATSYEPYQGNTYNIDLPVENLLPISSLASTTSNGITFTNNNDGTYTLNGTATAEATFYIFGGNTEIKANSKLTFSCKELIEGTRIFWYDNWAIISGAEQRIGSGKPNYTTTNEITTISQLRVNISVVSGTTVNNLTIKPMLEKGSKANSYTPYGTTPIELCKIGNYQDYFYKDSDKWYLHKEIGKVVLNGSETIDIYNQNTSRTNFAVRNILSGVESYTNSESIPNLLSNRFIPNTQGATWVVGNMSRRNAEGVNDYLYLTYEPGTTIEAFKTWLGTNNVPVYYVYATPTNTEITYQPLIDQLNLLEKAISYDSQTNISQVNNDKPFILDVTAIKSLQNVLDRIELLES